MSRITWSDDYAIGVAAIDRQHQKLISMINRLHDNCADGAQCDVLAQVLVEFNEYADYHFDIEQRLMREHDYPHQKGHGQQHEEYTAKSVDFLMAVLQDHKALPQEALDFFSQWWVQHIQGTDRMLGQFLQDCGVQ